jgi:drug/metabolite transporter (DMT)-like permease
MERDMLHSSQRHGIALATLTALLFAGSDALIKQLLLFAPLLLVLWLRYLFQIGVMSLWLVARRQASHRVGPWQLQLMRCSFLTVSSVSGYLALSHVSLAVYTALMMMAPVLSVVLGRVLLKETASAAQWLCVLLGLLGMLAVLRPGLSTWNAHMLWPVACAIAYAAFQVTSRKLMASADIVISNFLLAVFIATVTGFALLIWPVNWTAIGQELEFQWWVMLGGMCLFATAGQLTLTATHQKSTLSVAAPFAYLQIVFAVIIGLVFFEHWPDNMTLLGTALIAVGGATSAWLNGKSPAKTQLQSTTL